MPSCPICNIECVDTQGECSNCGWNLTINLQNISGIPPGFGANSEGSQKILHSIQKVWKKPETNSPCAASPSQEFENSPGVKQDLETTNELVSNLKSQLEEVTKERDELKKKLEQFERKAPQNTHSESLYEKDLTQTIKRVYELEESNKENINKFQTIEKNIHNIQNFLVFFEGIDTEIVKELPQKISQIEKHIEKFSEKIVSLESMNQRAKANSASEEASKSHSSHEPKATQERFLTTQDLQENQLVKAYDAYQQNNPPQYAIEVNATEDSINNNRLGGQDIFLTKITRGNYWIVNQEGFSYLVPKKNLIINQHSYKTAEALFECKGYEQGRPQQLRLLKPAKVFALPEGEKWRLDNKGILEFYSETGGQS